MDSRPFPSNQPSARRSVRSTDLAGAVHLYESEVDLFIYERESSVEIERAARQLLETDFERGQQIVHPGSTGVQALADELMGAEALARDLLALSEVVADLVGVGTVGVRLQRAQSPMCPSFHVDQGLLRAVVTYLVPGSEWLSEHDVERGSLGKPGHSVARPGAVMQRVPTFHVAFMKGARWTDRGEAGLVHRSPLGSPVSRLVATLDPFNDA